MAMRSIAQLDSGKLNRDGSNTITGNLDYTQHQARNISIHNVSALPPSGVAGQIVYNTSTQTFWYWNSILLQWIELVPGAGTGTSTSISAELIDPTTQVALYPFSLDIIDAFPFANLNVINSTTPTVHQIADTGSFGFYQPIVLKRQYGMIVTGDVASLFADARIGRLGFKGDVSNAIQTIQGYLPGSLSSVTVQHDLGDSNHVVLLGLDNFNSTLSIADVAAAGQLWVQVGTNSDIIYNSGSAGLKFSYIGTVLPLTTGLVTPNQMTGATWTHSIPTADHITIVVPICTSPILLTEAATLGGIAVKLGTNSDTIYCTGGVVSNIQLRVTSLQLT